MFNRDVSDVGDKLYRLDWWSPDSRQSAVEVCILASPITASSRCFLAANPIYVRGTRAMARMNSIGARAMRSWKETQLEFEMEVAKMILTRPELSYEKIGAMFGVSEDKVLSIIKRRGIQPGRKVGRKKQSVCNGESNHGNV